MFKTIAILLATVATISSSFFYGSSASPKTFYFTETAASGANHLGMQDGGSAPATARMTTGWIVGNSGTPPLYARMDSSAERAAASSTSTAQPNGNPDNTLGDCFRSQNTISGTFASGNWVFSMPVQGETRATSTHDGKIRIILYRSTSATGATPTQIGTVQTTSAYTDLANGASQTITVTFNPGAATLTGEYLFVQVAHQIDAIGNNAGSDTHLTTGTNAKLTTSTFNP